jgi:hypothetical protein
VFELEFKAASGLMQSDDFISLALSGHSVQGVEAFTLNESNSQPLLVSAAPFRVAENETWARSRRWSIFPVTRKPNGSSSSSCGS